jgi:hypothetical protein
MYVPHKYGQSIDRGEHVIVRQMRGNWAALSVCVGHLIYPCGQIVFVPGEHKGVRFSWATWFTGSS